MNGVTTHSEVLAAAAVALTAIDATPFQQNSLDEDFHEALAPFGPEDQGDAINHLGFAVFLRNSTPAQTRQQAGDSVEVDSAVDVFFSYRLRPTEQVADYRSALDAAEAVMAAILDPSWKVEASAVATEVAEIRQILDEPWLVVRLAFVITYEIGS